MRVLKIIVLALLVSYFLLACTKNNDIVITGPVTNSPSAANVFPKGTWEGQYTKSSRDSAAYLGFNVLDNGSLLLLNESHEVIGTGSWVLNDSLFNAYYIVYATQFTNTISGYAQCNPDKLYGKWQYNSNYQDAGTWFMDRVQ